MYIHIFISHDGRSTYIVNSSSRNRKKAEKILSEQLEKEYGKNEIMNTLTSEPPINLSLEKKQNAVVFQN